MRILVVDDHAGLLAEIVQYLTSCGHHATPAESGERAMEIVGSDREYDVVITDISMPGMNGIEMWDQMSALLPQAKVIFISSTNNSFLQRYLPGTFLPKPFDLAHLYDRVLQANSAAA